MSAIRKFSRRGLNKRSGGFTLIELMIAISIVGVLAAIAVPAFANYLARGRISEAINYAQGCKTGFLEYYGTSGNFPTSNLEANCPSITTDNVQAVTISNTKGIIVQLSTSNTIPSAARGKFIFLQPLKDRTNLAAANDVITGWACSISETVVGAPVINPAAKDFVPAVCRNNPK